MWRYDDSLVDALIHRRALCLPLDLHGRSQSPDKHGCDTCGGAGPQATDNMLSWALQVSRGLNRAFQTLKMFKPKETALDSFRFKLKDYFLHSLVSHIVYNWSKSFFHFKSQRFNKEQTATLAGWSLAMLLVCEMTERMNRLSIHLETLRKSHPVVRWSEVKHQLLLQQCPL